MKKLINRLRVSELLNKAINIDNGKKNSQLIKPIRTLELIALTPPIDLIYSQ
jgi:hypothetical protein